MSQPENDNVPPQNSTTTLPAAPAATPAPVIIKQSGGKGLAALALVLSLLGLGAGGFLFVQGQDLLARQQLHFDQKIGEAALGESQNAGLLADTVRKQQSNDSALMQLQAEVRRQQTEAERSSRAMQELLKNRSDWLVDETEVSLNLAAQQLAIADNLPAAVAVLESIDARLARFEQPQLLPLKQAISADLSTLKQRPYLDVSSGALRLNRLEAAVSGLPLVLDSSLRPPMEAAASSSETGTSWWQNAWNRTLDGLKGMVEVRHLDNPDAMLMSQEQIFYVRENLRLRLLSARVALMQRQGEIYQADIAAAETAVKQYFDVSAPAVQSWLQEMEGLKALQAGSTNSGNPLAASLKAVSDYRKQRGTEDLALPNTPAVAASEATGASEPASSAASAPSTPTPASPASVPTAPAAPATTPEPQGGVKS